MFIFVPASAFASDVARLKVFASILIAQYLVFCASHVGSAPVVVRYTESHVCSQ